jgi:hypothetical protein
MISSFWFSTLPEQVSQRKGFLRKNFYNHKRIFPYLIVWELSRWL